MPDDMTGGDDCALAEIDAIADELFFEWRSFDNIDCVDSRSIILIGGLRVRKLQNLNHR